jgi:hypothetical protein
LFPDKSVQQNETMNAVPGMSVPMQVSESQLPDGEIHVHMYIDDAGYSLPQLLRLAVV